MLAPRWPPPVQYQLPISVVIYLFVFSIQLDGEWMVTENSKWWLRFSLSISTANIWRKPLGQIWRIRCYRNWRWRRMFIDFLSFLLFHFVMALATLDLLGFRPLYFFSLFICIWQMTAQRSSFVYSLPKWPPIFCSSIQISFTNKIGFKVITNDTKSNQNSIGFTGWSVNAWLDTLIAWRPSRPSCPFQCKWQVHLFDGRSINDSIATC